MKKDITLLTDEYMEEHIMNTQIEITEEKAFEQDVKTMSYEELMATVRYLDDERQVIAKRVIHDDHKGNKNKKNIK